MSTFGKLARFTPAMPNIVDPYPRAKPGTDGRVTSDEFRLKDDELHERMENPRAQAYMAQFRERYVQFRERSRQWRPRYRINEESSTGCLAHAGTPTADVAVNERAEERDVEERRALASERPGRRAMDDHREQYLSDVRHGEAAIVDSEGNLVGGGLRAKIFAGQVVRAGSGEPAAENPFDNQRSILPRIACWQRKSTHLRTRLRTPNTLPLRMSQSVDINSPEHLPKTP